MTSDCSPSLALAYMVLSKTFSVVKPKALVRMVFLSILYLFVSTENKVRITPIKVIDLQKREGDEGCLITYIIENYHYYSQASILCGFSSYKGAISYFISRERKLLLNEGILLFGWRYLIEKALNQTKEFHI